MEWWGNFFLLFVAITALWTGLDCLLDPGMEYPWGPLGVALPTAVLVAPGAGVAATTRLPRRPIGLESAMELKAEGRRVCAVFVGDSLTQGSLSANWLELLASRNPGCGELVNCGTNMRPTGDLLEGGSDAELLESAAAADPERGVVVMLGTNDLVRFDLLSWPLRPSASAFVRGYVDRMREIVRRLREAGATRVTVVSPPVLGEDPSSEVGRFGRAMATALRRFASSVPGCRYVALYEATASALHDSSRRGQAPLRAYNPLESFLLQCLLPWQLYATQAPYSSVQEAQGFSLTLDLVHYGPEFASTAADLVGEQLGLE